MSARHAPLILRDYFDYALLSMPARAATDYAMPRFTAIMLIFFFSMLMPLDGLRR